MPGFPLKGRKFCGVGRFRCGHPIPGVQINPRKGKSPPACPDKTPLLNFELTWRLGEHQFCSGSFSPRPGVRRYFCTIVGDLTGILNALTPGLCLCCICCQKSARRNPELLPARNNPPENLQVPGKAARLRAQLLYTDFLRVVIDAASSPRLCWARRINPEHGNEGKG